MREKINKHRILWILVCILTVVSIIMMYLVHRAVPFMMDDLWYSTKLSSETPISDLGDIVESQVWHYFNWGGRSMTHGILQLTLLAGESAADVLNVAVTLLLGAVICLVAGDKSKKAVSDLSKDGRDLSGCTRSGVCRAGEEGMCRRGIKAAFGRACGDGLFLFWAAVSMLLGLNANWKMSMFWQAGAANYLYITVFVLLFLYCYLREVQDEGGRPDRLNPAAAVRDDCRKKLSGISLWVIPLGVLAGWSNENMGPAVWLISLAVIWLCAREGRKIPFWMIEGSLSCLFGSIMVVAAPGNFVRSAQVEENQYGLLWRVFLRCYGESKAAMEYLFPVLLLLAMVLIVSRGILKLPVGRGNLLLMFCALLSWGAMILSPHYPDRATFGTMTLFICVILSLIRHILEKHRELLGAAVCVGVLLWLRGMFFLGEFLALSWGWIR